MKNQGYVLVGDENIATRRRQDSSQPCISPRNNSSEFAECLPCLYWTQQFLANENQLQLMTINYISACGCQAPPSWILSLGLFGIECFGRYSVKENSCGHVNLKIIQCGNEAMRASKRNSRKDALGCIMTGGHIDGVQGGGVHSASSSSKKMNLFKGNFSSWSIFFSQNVALENRREVPGHA